MRVAVLMMTSALMVTSCSAQFNKCFDAGVASATPNLFNFTGVDTFGLRLFRLLAKDEPGNLVVSPYSVWSALSLALMGATGSNRLQLESALGLPDTKLEAYRHKFALDFLLSHLGSGVNNGPVLRSFDKAYFDTTVDLRSCVPKVMHNTQVLDFKDSSVAAAVVNNDVSMATGGTIKNLVAADNMVNSVFVLLNAVFFKGTWEEQFDVAKTTNTVFYNPQGKNVAVVPMMKTTAAFSVATSTALGATLLELPYENSNMSMIILLPEVDSPTLDSTLNALNPYTLGQALEALQASKKRQVRVYLPKFKLETRKEGGLVQALKTLKLTAMFNPASFGDFASRSNMFVDTVIHQAQVEVNEQGTVASAATGIAGTRIAPFTFLANRPFVFLVYAKDLKVTLFAGVIRDPSKV